MRAAAPHRALARGHAAVRLQRREVAAAPPRAEPADAARAEALAAAGILVEDVASPGPPTPAAPAARPVALRLAAAARAHPAKAATGGEDAFFALEGDASSPFGGALGVADGVGGWAESGVDPSSYARALMTLTRAVLEGAASDLPAAVTPALVAGCPPNASPAGGGAPPLSETGFGGGPAVGAAALAGAPPPPPLPSPLPPDAAPRAALAAAHARVKLPGSATALVALLDGRASTLHGVNLGDSGLAVLRAGRGGGGLAPTTASTDEDGSALDGPPFALRSDPASAAEAEAAAAAFPDGEWAPVFRTTPQQHFFDCPFQLAGGPDTDAASDADGFAVAVQRGDAIVAGSDGLWDNLWLEEAAALLPPPPPEPSTSESADEWAATAAGRLASLASSNAGDSGYPSPYAAEALAAAEERGGEEAGEGGGGGLAGLVAGWLRGGGQGSGEERAQAKPSGVGGKQDDITVVVGLVV